MSSSGGSPTMISDFVLKEVVINFHGSPTSISDFVLKRWLWIFIRGGAIGYMPTKLGGL